MHVIEALRRLQAADHEWQEKGTEFKALRKALTDQTPLESERTAQTAREKALAETHGELTRHEMELRSLQAHLKQVNDQLYADSGASAREVNNLRKDADQDKRQIAKAQDVVFELMTRQEEQAAAAEEGKTALAAFEQDWQSNGARGVQRYKMLRTELQELKALRESLHQQIGTANLALYHELWRNKQGSPLAEMVDGRCSACRVGVPSQKQRDLEGGSDAPVACDGCGRILYVR